MLSLPPGLRCQPEQQAGTAERQAQADIRGTHPRGGSIEKSDESKRQFGLTEGERRRYAVVYWSSVVPMDRRVIVASRAAREVRVRLLALSVAIPGLVIAP